MKVSRILLSFSLSVSLYLAAAPASRTPAPRHGSYKKSHVVCIVDLIRLAGSRALFGFGGLDRIADLGAFILKKLGSDFADFD